MKLWYFRGHAPNFGDELNAWIWPRVIGDHLDQDGSTLFLGIGSILFNRFDPEIRKIVFGSGFGGYSAPPNMHDGSWDVRFVRGPQTVRLMNLDPKLAGYDPAILLREHIAPPATPGTENAFMPHWESLDRGHWDSACKLAGFTLIDPREPLETIIAKMQAAKLVVSEAMHGAIVADALRVPWIPVSPIDEKNRMKWQDWAESLSIDLKPQFLAPSSLEEIHLSLPRHRPLRGAARVIKASPVRVLAETAATRLAARRLRQIAQLEPSLSSDLALQRGIDRLHEEIHAFRKAFPTRVRQPQRLRAV